MTLITAEFKNPEPGASIAFRPVAAKIGAVVRYLQANDPLSKEWFLTRDTLNESLLYPVFDGGGALTTAAEAVLETEYKGENVRFLSMWNGQTKKSDAVSLIFSFHDKDWPKWTLTINYRGSIERLGDYRRVADLLSIIATTLSPVSITVSRDDYFEKQVFQDRPGVGWMLYLPHALTAKQVPEARALIPVLVKDQKGKDDQIGTIIVSITDELFSDENPEHIKIANAIEIRLVDQDLIPLFGDD